jgi:hypothetical protein
MVSRQSRLRLMSRLVGSRRPIQASAVGADVGVMARRTVDGVVHAAVETRRDVARTAQAAVKSAIKAAGRVGSKGARAVEHVLAGVVRGLDDMVDGAPARRAIVRNKTNAAPKKAGAALRKAARAPAKRSPRR